MKATEILIEEHGVIERVIAAMEKTAHTAMQGGNIRPTFFLEAAEFIKGFADGCHHKKEEGVLFPAMVKAGIPSQGGPIGVMLSEHEQGRIYTKGMREAAQNWDKGDQPARQTTLHNALGYCTLLKQHIYKENNILFPMADRIIPHDLQSKIADDFERIEHEETGEGIHEKYLALAEALEKEAQ